MTGFTFTLSCAACDGEVRYVTGGGMGTHSNAVVACRECGSEWAVLAFLGRPPSVDSDPSSLGVLGCSWAGVQVFVEDDA